MIVPMKKVTVIVRAEDSVDTIKGLRSLGVLHVEHARPPEGADIASLKEDIAAIDKAIAILSAPQLQPKEKMQPLKKVHDWRAAAKHFSDEFTRVDRLEEYGKSLVGMIADWEGWGDFDPKAMEGLAGKGVFVRLYELPEREIRNFDPSAIIKVMKKEKGLAYVAAISRAPEINTRFKEIPPPKMPLGEMKKRLEENAKTIALIREDLERHTALKDRFIDIRDAFRRELDFHETVKGMGDAGKISYVTGYVPADNVGSVRAAAVSGRWGMVVRDPADDDAVPTLIRSPKWVRLITPVLSLLEILPGYKELDMSPLFLLFLGLFFGMIIGDAGYGSLYILLTLFFRYKFGAGMKSKTIFHLLYFFSACAVFWGLITGTVFGQEWYTRAGLRPLIPVLNDTRFLQAFCFFLGAFHLTLAHAWQAARKAPSLTALSDLGWIMILWSAFFYAKMLILSDALPQFVNYALSAGAVLVVFFTNPQRNIFKSAGEGLGTLALSIMNNFTDVVSYVRLFAVGLAGVAIADTVNTLAGVFGGDNFLIKAAILFVGHTINIVLGPISVLVHGIRLNVLEFSGHAGLTWSGTPYRPLKAPEKI